MSDQERLDEIEDACNCYEVSKDLDQVMPLVKSLCDEIRDLHQRLKTLEDK